MNNVLHEMRPNGGKPPPPPWSKKRAKQWAHPTQDEVLEGTFTKLTQWDRLSTILPPEGRCSWQDQVQVRAPAARRCAVPLAACRAHPSLATLP